MENNIDELNDQFKKSAEIFSLNPSPGTWQNVERAIRIRERKKRFIIIFFLLAGILAGGMFLFTFQSPTPNQQTDSPEHNRETQEQKSTNKYISDGKNISKKYNSSTLPAFTENKTPDNKSTSPHPPTANSDSHSADNQVLTTSAHIDFHETISAPNNPPQPEMNNSEISLITPGTEINPESDSILVNKIDTLEVEAPNDSLPAAKTFISKPDSSIAEKDSIQSTPRQSKWSIAIGVAPTISFTKQYEEGDYQIISNYRDSSDKTLLAWNYYLAIHYTVIPELEIFAGIGIINFEQEILNHQAVYEYDTLNMGPIPAITITRDYFNINGNSTGTVKNKFSYLETALGLRYKFLPAHKFNISLQAGVSFNKLIRSDGYSYNYQNFEYEKMNSSGLKSWMVSYGAGLSFQYAILKYLHIEFTPCYKRFQKSIYSDNYPVSQRLQQVEFRLSLRWLLK